MSADPMGPAHQNRFQARGDFMVKNKIGHKFKVETRSGLFGRQEENFNRASPELEKRFFI